MWPCYSKLKFRTQGLGGYPYLVEPLWWVGLIAMLVGEVANFVAYVFAPAVLVTPLGALSIIVSAILAHFILKERLQMMGILGCISCIMGYVVIVIHAPQEQSPSSVEEIWILATQPAFLLYSVDTLVIVLALILHFEPRYGQTNILVYLSICSLMGSLTVVSIKAIGIAIKLTLEGTSQDWYGQSLSSIASELCRFITVLSGTALLHMTREQELNASAASISWYVCKGSLDQVKDIENDYFAALLGSDCIK